MEEARESDFRKVDSNSYMDADDLDLSRLLDKPRLIIERKRSLDERSISEISIAGNFRNVESYESMFSPMATGVRSGWNTPASSTPHALEPHPMVSEAWDALRRSLVYFRGLPVGTMAAFDNQSEEVLNYDQVFVRDFVPSAMAFLMNGESDIVKNFLLKTLQLQSWEKRIDRFKLGEGVMPASFKVLHDPIRKTDTIAADFGESAIGRVAPIDSGFWWIILLRAYTKSTGDISLAESSECQKGMRLILSLCLSEGFDTFPTLLCADGCSMIDRRMGIYGYPIEIQSVFFMALRCAFSMLKHDTEGKEFIERIVKRLHALSYHMRTYFWLDFQQLNIIYRYKTEEYSHTAVNKFNVIPDSIPDWLFDFMPTRGGYFIGNVSPARMDFRWFALGNFFAILSCLATPEQSTAIMDLIEERWEELVGEMPLKIIYPLSQIPAKIAPHTFATASTRHISACEGLFGRYLTRVVKYPSKQSLWSSFFANSRSLSLFPASPLARRHPFRSNRKLRLFRSEATLELACCGRNFLPCVRFFGPSWPSDPAPSTPLPSFSTLLQPFVAVRLCSDHLPFLFDRNHDGSSLL